MVHKIKRNRRISIVAVLLGISVFLVGCSEPAKTEAVSAETTTEKISVAETEEKVNKEEKVSAEQEAAMKACYASILKEIYETQTFPDGTNPGYDGYGEISENTYAVYDIDADGKDELLINYTTTYMAGMMISIYGYDYATNEVAEEFVEFPAVTFYSNGIIMASMSHNHGRAATSDFWPYSLYQYEEKTDSYVSVATVDAWDKKQMEEAEGVAFPEEADLDGDGLLYYVMTDWEYENPMDGKEYEEWLDSQLKDAELLNVPFLNLTPENISSLTGEVQKATSPIENTLEGEDQSPVTYLEFQDYQVCFGEEGKEAQPLNLSLISEQTNTITWAYDWFKENNLFLPMLSDEWENYLTQAKETPPINPEVRLANTVFYDENYLYDWSADSLHIYDKNTTELIYTIYYQTDQWYLMGNCAYLENGILYLGYVQNGYAQPGTCYLLAYDLEQDKVIWRSENQTYNTMNFLVKDNIILCGYGFTDEKDYLYQIDKSTGKVLEKTELKKKPDLLVEKDGLLYVHTYSYDYVFEMK
ncbi:MAG: hypothetical protein ACI4VG_01085 [Lachnospiraceae bacterium]